MDQRDEFTKWVAAVEEALKSEGKELSENMPCDSVNECGCGSWNCPVCFPDQNEVEFSTQVQPAGQCGDLHGSMSVCPTCGHQEHQHMGMSDVELGLEEVSPMDDEIGSEEMMASPMEEEPEDFTSTPMPRSSDGRGVKLGDIVQKTEFKQVGQESPLTYGEDNLDEAGYEDDDDYSDLGRYEPKEYEMPDYDADPLAVRDYYNRVAGEPKSEDDVESAMDMISTIKYMQREGMSQSERDYSEDELANSSLPQLMKIYAEVTGNNAAGGIMENVDKDVAAMLASLKKYDKLVESVAPVLGMKTLGEKAKPDFLDVDKDGDEEEPMKKALKDKEKKEEVKESSEIDPDILEWMARFAKLGKL